MKLVVGECAGLRALAGVIYCMLALTLADCQVYDRAASHSRAAGVQTARDASADCTTRTDRDAACVEDAQTDDCAGDAANGCTLPHAQAVCREGTCEIARCTDDYRDCDQERDNGCEVAPDAIEHCGQCHRVCSAEHGSTRCSEGRCELERCDEGFADCDGNGKSCEVELASDAVHCGVCERSCGFRVETAHASALCRQGSCQAKCAEDYDDCDGKHENGCETSLLTNADCGQCGAACQLANADAQCMEGVCKQLACATGYADCDADSQACESSLSDVASCGSCEQHCEFPHAQARCNTADSAFRCELAHCDDGWENCDGALANGCERDTRSIEAGGAGPCLPDPSCRRERLGDRELFFCDMGLTWEAARSACQRQLGGDLAVLRDAETRIFLLTRLNERVWIGHNNLRAENVWTWASTNVVFWQGTSTGRAQNGAYTRWARGEPNGSGRCGALSSSTEMDDLACSTVQPFICELAPDECPDDPTKFHRGQCGCGISDTDSDQNGYAECPD